MTKVPQPLFPRAPAHVAPYVEVLGVELAVEYFLTFGGSVVYLPENPAGGSEVEALIGAEKVRALRNHDYHIPARCPIPKKWLAQVLAAKGLSVQKIARKLHIADKTVRQHLKSAPDPRQPSLF